MTAVRDWCYGWVTKKADLFIGIIQDWHKRAAVYYCSQTVLVFCAAVSLALFFLNPRDHLAAILDKFLTRYILFKMAAIVTNIYCDD